MNLRFPFWILVLLVFFLSSCKKGDRGTHWREGAFLLNDSRYKPVPYVELEHPSWTRSATIYEVNIRQFTPEGTFKAFEAHLPRLKEMGIDILWIMPIHPIGEKKRKGPLGSPYSVRDYYAVNPEFGTLEDFKELVDQIHQLGMHVILDWVANHSSPDNILTEEHPEWYTHDKSGHVQPTPWYDWEDVIDFDYSQPDLRRYMTEAMKFWVAETDIDGFRCDAAGFIPLDFWENTRKELDRIKRVFMLAEWESRDLHARAFDMTYAWSLWDRLHRVCTGKDGIGLLQEYIAQDVNAFPEDGYRMVFTDNHDKNAWEGNQFTYFGAGIQPAIVLTATVSGMPMVYSGQEAGLDRSLALFEKDSIPWKPHVHAALYTQLFRLKHKNPALRNGSEGGVMQQVRHNQPEKVLAFCREKSNHRVIPILNFSADSVVVVLNVPEFSGAYRELFSNKPFNLSGSYTISLPAWGYKVLYR
ncbi:MAG: alpha-amylase family glycosyl hydrolase [Haliscomenobacter sp.]